jgi:hypothetical protein
MPIMISPVLITIEYSGVFLEANKREKNRKK